MLESKMRKALNHQFGKQHVIQPIESLTSIGIPDIFFRADNREGWIELKQAKETAKGGINIPFRPGQYLWIQRYIKRKGYMILLCTFEGNEKYFFAFRGYNIREEYSNAQFYSSCYWQGHIEYFPF